MNNNKSNKKLLQKRRSAPILRRHIQRILPLDDDKGNQKKYNFVVKPSQPEPRPRSRSEEERLLKIALHESMHYEKVKPQKQVDKEQLELELALVQSLSAASVPPKKNREEMEQEELLNQALKESLEVDRYKQIQQENKKRVANQRLMWFINEEEEGNEPPQLMQKQQPKPVVQQQPKFVKQKLNNRAIKPKINLNAEHILEKELYAPRRETPNAKQQVQMMNQQQNLDPFAIFVCGIKPPMSPNDFSSCSPSLSPVDLKNQSPPQPSKTKIEEEMKILNAMFAKERQNNSPPPALIKINKLKPPEGLAQKQESSIISIIQAKKEPVLMPQPALHNEFKKREPHKPKNVIPPSTYSFDLNSKYDVIQLVDADEDAKDNEFKNMEALKRHFPSIPSLSPGDELELKAERLRVENEKLKSKLESFNIISSLLKEAKYNYSPELWHLITEICQSQEQR